MNYFAHGYRYVDRPWFCAGTALPDLLRASHRRARVPKQRVVPNGNPVAREVALGVLQHIRDDEHFHATEAFQRTEVELTDLLRSSNGKNPRQRTWFFGHVLGEMLLDAWLIEHEPSRLDAYYGALEQVDPSRLAGWAAAWSTQTTERLPEAWERFLNARFLGGYRTDEGVLRRMNGVARRLGLPTWCDRTIRVLPEARRIVFDRAEALLAS